jgi:hypothetical protein
MSISREKVRFVPRSSARWSLTTTNIGVTNDHGTGATGYLFGYAITTTVAGLLRSIGVNIYSAAGNIRVGIYSTYSGGKFSGLLWQSASTPVIAGWNDLPVDEVYLAASTTYYLVFQQDNVSLNFYAVASGTQYYCLMAYGPFVDPSAALSTNTATKYMRIITGKFV